MEVKHLECLKCRKIFTEAPGRYVCSECGIDGILEVVYDYHSIKISREEIQKDPRRSLWRYEKLLPVKPGCPVSPLQVGWSPLYRLPNFEKKLKINEVYLKDDGRNPTCSLKDRASAVGTARALQEKCQAICAASTGNAASSLAGFAASLGIKTFIFVPKRAPKAKIAQLLVYGANTLIIDDTYDRAFELSVQASEKFGFYNRNCAYNPYLVEGKKTVAYEIWEQLALTVPDRIYVSIGDGCITSGLFKGFYDLTRVGLSDRIPRIIGVQAAGCNPVEVALKTGVFTPQDPKTIADSIAVGVPRNRLKALHGLKESHGDCISVSDDEIKTALVEMPRQTGVFGEPAGVTAFAGFQKDAREGRIDPKERVVVLITGNGLKDIDSALSVCELPSPLAPVFAEVEKVLSRKA
jgi:threonine synthase